MQKFKRAITRVNGSLVKDNKRENKQNSYQDQVQPWSATRNRSDGLLNLRISCCWMAARSSVPPNVIMMSVGQVLLFTHRCSGGSWVENVCWPPRRRRQLHCDPCAPWVCSVHMLVLTRRSEISFLGPLARDTPRLIYYNLYCVRAGAFAEVVWDGTHRALIFPAAASERQKCDRHSRSRPATFSPTICPLPGRTSVSTILFILVLRSDAWIIEFADNKMMW